MTGVASSRTNHNDGSIPDGRTIPASVPGNVELDLQRAGLLPELYMGSNVHRAREYEQHEWWYRTSFDSPIVHECERVQLVFNAVDCVATYWLNGEVVAIAARTVGIRRIELVRTESTDRDGSGEFLFRVNDTPVMCKGTNWVPADASHSRDAERYPALLELIDDLGCNMVRCWGGGVYEDAAFFDFCDSHGIMVWQDFAMACAIYPQDRAFLVAIAAEAKQVLRQLRGHASLVLWCGDNECDNGWPDPSANRITREVLPDLVRRFDPATPYVPSSPYWSCAAKVANDRSRLPETTRGVAYLERSEFVMASQERCSWRVSSTPPRMRTLSWDRSKYTTLSNDSF